MEKKVAELQLHLNTLAKALNTLEAALREPFSLIVQDAAIQRFEYTFELAWKLFRRVAGIEGIEARSPRMAIRAAYDVGLLDDIDIWFEMLEASNLTSHTYNEATASQVYECAGRLPDSLRPVLDQVRKRYLS